MACSREGESESDTSASNLPESVNWVFRALANRHRRAVVRALDETHTPATQTALATYVAREILPESEQANFISFRRETVAGLHHVHLPVLERAGIIEIDAGKILLGKNYHEAVTLVEAMS